MFWSLGDVDYGAIFGWSLALIIALGALGLGIMYFRQRLVSGDEPTNKAGFTLADLRELHRKGQMSDDEFAKAKAQLVSVLKKPAQSQSPGAMGDSRLRGGDGAGDGSADPRR